MTTSPATAATATVALPPIALIGGGNMGTAIAEGLARLAPPPAIAVCDPVADLCARHRSAGRFASADLAEVIGRAPAGVVVLAVKPQSVGDLLPLLKPLLTPGHLVVSILAGTTTARIEAGLAAGTRVVRAMPNTPMAVGRGMVGIAAGAHATAKDLDVAEAVFAPAAKVLRVEESRIDAITAVSGSGPAYVFRFVESFLAGAEAVGFTRDEAALLVAQTVQGSVDYLLSQPGLPAAALRRQVTSPGGTTAAALQFIDAAQPDDVYARALQAAVARARVLAKA